MYVYTRVSVCIYIHIHMLCVFCQSTVGEISYNHTQMWVIADGVTLIAIARSIGMKFFQPHLQLTYFYPGRSGV